MHSYAWSDSHKDLEPILPEDLSCITMHTCSQNVGANNNYVELSL